MIRFSWIATLWLLLAFPAQALDYHVCSNGSDSNDGLSHASAWKTFAKANNAFSSLLGGDRILFCRGEQFDNPGGLTWDNRNSTRNNRITISSYAPPGGADLDYPVIYSQAGGKGFSLLNGGNAEHKEGLVISKLVLRGNKTSTGIFIYNDTDFVRVSDVEIYDFRIGIHAAGSNPPNAGSDGKNSDLHIQRVSIHDNDTQGFLGGGDNLIIEDSAFVNNGWDRASLNHNIYISVSGSNETIRNNWLYQSAMFTGECKGVSLVAHGVHPNLLIEGNVIWEDVGAVDPGCWGISIDNGYGGSSPEQFQGLRIRDNTIVNVGNLAIGCSVCQDVIIERNTIVHQNPFGMISIASPNRDENSYPMLDKTDNVTIRDNIILHDSTSTGVGVKLGDGDVSNYSSENNRIYYNPAAGMIAGCERYDPADLVTVSGGVCQNSVPQKLLKDALALTVVPKSLSSSSKSSDSNGSNNSGSGGGGGGGGAFDWPFLVALLLVFGLRRTTRHSAA